MLNIANVFFCILSIAYVSAGADSSDDCQCFTDVENNDALQALDKLITQLSSAPNSYFSYGERPHYRKKKSAGYIDDFWRSRDQRGAAPVHLPSSFTPRLGRRDEPDSRKPIEIRSHLINLHAGSPFTPRLGRRGKSYN